MFSKATTHGYVEAVPGIDRRTLVHGEKSLMAEFRMKKGSTLPLHAHPYEQTGFLVSGGIRLKCGDEVFEARAGDSWCVPSDQEHSAEILEDSVAIEIFSPPRPDYLP